MSDPGPGSGTVPRGVPSAASCSASSATAWRLRASTSSGGPSGGSRRRTPSSTESGSSATSSRQCSRPGVRGSVDGQPPARRSVGGAQVEQAVALDPRRALDVVGLGEQRVQRRPAVQVADPDAVAARRADVAGDHQPAAVAGDVHGVVRVPDVEAGPVDQPVLARRGADAVAPHAAVEGLLARGHLVGVDHADVDELGPAGQPRHRRVAAPVDRRLRLAAGGDVDDVQHRVLVAARRDLVGQQPALQVGQPGVEGGAAGAVDRHRVDQHALVAVRAAHEHDRVFLPGLPARPEPPTRPPQGRAHRARVEQGVHAGGQCVAAGQLGELGRGQFVLGARPGDGAFVGRVFQPTVGVGDALAVQDVDDVEPWGGGVDGGLPHACRG